MKLHMEQVSVPIVCAESSLKVADSRLIRSLEICAPSLVSLPESRLRSLDLTIIRSLWPEDRHGHRRRFRSESSGEADLCK